MIADLNNDSFLILAMKAYDKPSYIMSEFEEDMSRIVYVNRLINKYLSTGVLKERLILNHLITISNVFGVEFGVRLLFYKLPSKTHSILKTFLVFLNHMPRTVKAINGKDIQSSDILIDQTVANSLRTI